MERRVLVTGAGSGIGRATSLHLAGLGFAVLGVVHEDADGAALQAAAGAAGLRVATATADLADPSERAAVMDQQRLYAVVNNAGFMNAGLVRDVSIESAVAQLQTMVVAPVDLARRAMPHMMERGEGRIVNITSAGQRLTAPYIGWYRAAKAALRELTDALRIELEGTGIDVVEIQPGSMDTGLWRKTASELRRRSRASGRPDQYDPPLRLLRRMEAIASDPQRVAEGVGLALTTLRPRRHRRIGYDATMLRLASDAVPDAVLDRATRAVTRLGRAS